MDYFNGFPAGLEPGNKQGGIAPHIVVGYPGMQRVEMGFN
jgi:hypothetical protein